MWRQEPSNPIDNLDNYLSAIENAKKELLSIYSEIDAAKARRDDILAEKDEVIKSKLDEVEHHKKNAEAAHAMAREIHAKNLDSSDKLEDGHKKLANQMDDFNVQKANHAKYVLSKEKEFSEREENINSAIVKNMAKEKELEMKAKEGEVLLNKFLDEHKKASDLMAAAQKQKEDNSAYDLTLKTRHKEIIAYKVDAENALEEAKAKLAQAQIALEESRKNKKDASDSLAKLIEEKQTYNDIIIESKKEKMEAINLTKAAQKNIAEVNLKIAELNDLKAALANQENKNVT